MAASLAPVRQIRIRSRAWSVRLTWCSHGCAAGDVSEFFGRPTSAVDRALIARSYVAAACESWSPRTSPASPARSRAACGARAWRSTSRPTAPPRSTRRASIPYDVVVLDRDLPELHGDEVCRTLTAEQPRTKVLMLTAARSTDELVQGLSLGADDYLTKPFRFAELVARLHALGRRTGEARPPVLERRRRRARPRPRAPPPAPVEPLDLTLKEFAVLQALLEAAGRGRHARGAARARLGRAARPALEHRPHDGHDAAPQARRPAAHPDGPRERLPRVISNLRVRLTAIYGGLFLVFVAVLLGVSYWLMARHLDRTRRSVRGERRRSRSSACSTCSRWRARRSSPSRARLGARGARAAVDAGRVRRARALRGQRLARAALPADRDPHRGRRDAVQPRRRRRRAARDGRARCSARPTRWTRCSRA